MPKTWTEEVYKETARLYLSGLTAREVSARIGSTTASVAVHLSQRGITRERATCIICTSPLPAPKPVGKKPQFCGTRCKELVKQAHITNNRIDARVNTHCLACGQKLVPPWTTKKKWCSRICSRRGWHEAVWSNPQLREKRKDYLYLSRDRKKARDHLTVAQTNWLLSVRMGHEISSARKRTLRRLLMLPDNNALTKYARAINTN